MKKIKTKRPKPKVVAKKLDIAEANLRLQIPTDATRMSDPEIQSIRDGIANHILDTLTPERLTGDPNYLTDVHRAVKGVSLFKIDKPSGIAFPGDGLARLCTDFGAGSAGIALFLARVLHQKSNFNFKLDALLPSFFAEQR